MSTHLVGDEAGILPDTQPLERDVQRAIVDFVARLLVVGFPLYVVFVGVEFVGGTGSPLIVFQSIVVTAMSLTIWFSTSLRARGAALVYGVTGLGLAALFHFGPMLGTGLFYLSAALLSSFLGSRRQTAVVCVVLSLSIVMPSLLGVGPSRVELDDVAWLRIALATSFPLIAAAYLFRTIRASVVESMRATVQAAQQASALEEERRQLFVSAMQAQRLESLGRLSGEVAHEFNNALVAVRGGVDLLTESVDDDGVEILDMMAKSLDNATRTARSLLDFSHSESSTGQSDAGEVIDGVVTRLRAIVSQSIEIEGKMESGLLVGLGPSDLEQVVLNLLINAVDAMPDGGRIAVECIRRSDRVVITVSDEGVGMSSDAVARIFEPFYTTKVEDGTGLGLAVVYGHVTRAQGSVHAESSEGKGTTLTVDLPVVEEESGGSL